MAAPARRNDGGTACGSSRGNKRGNFAASGSMCQQLEGRGVPAGSRLLDAVPWAGAWVPKDHMRACGELTKHKAGEARDGGQVACFHMRRELAEDDGGTRLPAWRRGRHGRWALPMTLAVVRR